MTDKAQQLQGDVRPVRRVLRLPRVFSSPFGASALFVARQLLRFALLLVAVSIVAFVLVSVSPIDPVQANVGQAAYLNMSEAKREQLVQYWGSGTPIWERYGAWAQAILHGDWGTSLRFNAPVPDVLAPRLASSLALMTSAWLLSGVLGVVLGIVAAVWRDRWPDRLIKGYCFVLASTPTFWLGLVFLVVFAVWLGWFPLGFSVPIGVSASEVTLAQSIHHLVLPALTLSVVGVANIALHTREKAVDVLQSDYVRQARTRGESTPSIVMRHGLRNLALPALTLQCASISEIFGGSVLVEQVFSYPGLGQAAVTAGLGGDAPLLVAIAVLSAAIVFVGNLAANILYGVIDPRIRTRRSSLRVLRRGELLAEEAGERRPDA
ncbi:MAG: ABC transporter permease [Coriobacteriales bacterium]|jgi:peptide/nickel transport system permease protein|nr:ABC transporter permease [Coriobacteriales bacterium]